MGCVKSQPEQALALEAVVATAPAPAKKKWVVDDGEYKFDPSTATAADIDDPSLLAGPIIGIAKSADGSSGVFFVVVASGVYVLKGAANAAQECFSHKLADQLKIAVPRTKCLQFGSNDMNTLTESILAATKTPTATGYAVRNLLDFPVVLLLEFVHGKTLPDAPVLRLWLHRNLRQIGEMVALDCLLNNSDRVPLLWDNPGNAKNIMVTERGIVGIDQPAVTLPESSPERQKYVDRLEELLGRVATDSSEGGGGSSMEPVATFIGSSADIRLSATHAAQLLVGFRAAMGNIAALSSADLQSCKDGVAASVVMDATSSIGSAWSASLDGIDLTFLAAVVGAVARAGLAPAPQDR
jgi:hypothetical protein